MAPMDKHDDNDQTAEEVTQRRDALLLNLLKTPPQPRPKRKRAGTKSGGLRLRVLHGLLRLLRQLVQVHPV